VDALTREPAGLDGDVWRLTSADRALIAAKSRANRLRFAVMLLFFRDHGRFPRAAEEVDAAAIAALASDLGVPVPWEPVTFDSTDRTLERQRAEIRTLFDFREATVADAATLGTWLRDHAVAQSRDHDRLAAELQARCRALRIEPPTPERIERIVRGAVRAYEERLTSTIHGKLSPEVRGRLDALLHPVSGRPDDDADEPSASGARALLNFVRGDPGRASLDSVMRELDRLQAIRAIGLPADLFADALPHEIELYRQRVAVQPPSDLRRLPEAVRITWLAAFVYLRGRALTDSLVELLVETVHAIGARAERRVEQQVINEIRKVSGKNNLLFEIANASLAQPDGQLDAGLPRNPHVKITARRGGWIIVSPLQARPDPENIEALKAEVSATWPLTSLLDIIKEADLRLNFTDALSSPTAYETLDRTTLRPRLLLCLHGLGTNAGLKRMDASRHGGPSYRELAYARRRYITPDRLRRAIAIVTNGTLRVRNPRIWGDGTTACASDSKHFGAWDQNLTTQWHVRYGGRGIMIYWHVEKKSLCIHSQLKSPSSSEVAVMIEGVIRHCTEMAVDRQYVDSHGQSEVAFAFCRLLGFQLLPRLKNIGRQRLYRPAAGEAEAYPHLRHVLTRPIDWELIRQQYDEMVKYATALRLGTAETEAILRRFTRANIQHPTYKALAELGKAIKTIFLCRYLHDEALRREINDGLNVIEHWNSANDFVFFARHGELGSNRHEDHELSMLSLHLLQNCMVFVNTLMLQQVLARPHWANSLTPRDQQAITPLIWDHVTPYGRYELDMDSRIPILT